MLPEYLNINKRYYYTKLNNSEKRLYEFMVDCLMNNHMKFIYKYEFDDIDLNSDDLPVFTASILESIIMTKVWTYMLLDFPEFYFVHEFEFYHEGNVIYMGSKKPYYEVCEINEINKKLEDILLNFESLTDEYEIVYAVNDFICKNYEYDSVTKDYNINNNNNFDNSIWKRHREKFTIAGLVKYGIGVCSALSGLAQFILQRKGIKVINVDGQKSNEEFGHKWLLVNLDNEYYNLDVTFNNTLSNDPSLPKYMFLNNDYDLSKHIYLPQSDEECELLKNSNGIKYNYYYKNDLLFNDINKLKYKLKENILYNLTNKQTNINSRYYYYFRITNDFVNSLDNDKSNIESYMKKYDIEFKPYLNNFILEFLNKLNKEYDINISHCRLIEKYNHFTLIYVIN